MKADKKLSIKVKSKTERRIMEDPELEMISEWNIKRILIALIVFILVVILPAYYFSNTDNSDTSPPVAKKSVLKTPDLIKKTPVKKVVVENTVQATVVNKTPVQVTATEPAIEQKPEHTPEKTIIAKPSTNPTVVDVPSKQVVEANKQEAIVEKQEQQKSAVSPANLNPNISRAQLAPGINKLEPHGNIELPILVDKSKAYPVVYFTEVINMQGDTVFHEWLHGGESVFKRKINIRGNRWRISTSKLFPYNSTGLWQVRIITSEGDVLNQINFSVEKR